MKVFLAFLMVLQTHFAFGEPYVAPEHHHFHQWYKDIQKQLDTSGCCDDENNDCGPVSAYQDLGVSGVRVLLEDGKWHTATRSQKFHVMTPDGKAHVCRRPAVDDYNGKPTGQWNFYCIFLPLMTG